MLSQPVVGCSDGIDAIIFPEGVVRRVVEDIYACGGIALKWAIDKIKLYVVGKFGAECSWCEISCLEGPADCGVANKSGSGR